MIEHEPAPAGSLSAAGQARREAILVGLRRELVKRRGARKVIRASVAAALPAAALCVWFAASSAPRAAVEIGPAGGAGAGAVASLPAHLRMLKLEIVRDDPKVLARCLASDEELMAFLDEAHRPSGLVRFGGQAYLANELTGD